MRASILEPCRRFNCDAVIRSNSGCLLSVRTDNAASDLFKSPFKNTPWHVGTGSCVEGFNSLTGCSKMQSRAPEMDASTIAVVNFGTVSLAIGLIGLYLAFKQLQVSLLRVSLRSMVRSPEILGVEYN